MTIQMYTKTQSPIHVAFTCPQELPSYMYHVLWGQIIALHHKGTCQANSEIVLQVKYREFNKSD